MKPIKEEIYSFSETIDHHKKLYTDHAVARLLAHHTIAELSRDTDGFMGLLLSFVHLERGVKEYIEDNNI